MENQRIKNKEDIDLEWLIANIQDLIEEIESWEFHEDNDRPHWIQEAAIDASCLSVSVSSSLVNWACNISSSVDSWYRFMIRIK